MNKHIPTLITCFFAFLFSGQAQAWSMKDHLTIINQVICEKMASSDCKSERKPPSVEKCVKLMSKGSEEHPENATINIPEAPSKACASALRKIPASECKSVMKQVTQPPCDMRTLLGL